MDHVKTCIDISVETTWITTQRHALEASDQYRVEMSELLMVHHHRNVQGGAARAAVFGVSDGLVSNVGLILGVAAADGGSGTVLVAGAAGLLAGAFSMAAGEYISVKAQAELVERELAIERVSLSESPKAEIRELSSIYQNRGVPKETADELAEAMMVDPEVALEVHAREELGIDPSSVGNPVESALSSFVAFSVGAILPVVPWLFAEGRGAIYASLIIGLGTAAIVGATLAYFTERSKVRTVARQVAIAAVTCAFTWVLGRVVGSSLG